MDWLTLPTRESEFFNFVNGDLITVCLSPSLLQVSSKVTFLKQLEAQVRWRMHIFSVFHVAHNYLSVLVLTTQFPLKD